MENFHEKAVLRAIADCVLESPFKQPARVQEDKVEKSEIERVAKRFLQKELPDEVVKLLKKELKTDKLENLVTQITGKALARFFEIMFTRRGTWQSQLKI